jgi:hypothetical protein
VLSFVAGAFGLHEDDTMKALDLLFVSTVLVCGGSGPAPTTAHAATLAHYRFEDARDDGRIYQFIDSGPNHLNGVVEGEGWFVASSSVAPYAGVGQFALSAFHGACSARLPLQQAEAPLSGFTIEFFFQPALSPYAYEGPALHERRAILTRLDPSLEGNGVAWAFEYEPCTGRVLALFSFGGAATESCHLGDFRDGRWHHIAMVYQVQGNSVAMWSYIDGQMGSGWSSTGHPKAVWGSGPLIVGAVKPEFGDGKPPERQSFVGLLDEVRISAEAFYPSRFVVDLSPKPLMLTITPKVEIAFPTSAGNYYQVQWASQLNTNQWYDLGRHVVGDGLTNVVYDTVTFGANCLYRVHVFD